MTKIKANFSSIAAITFYQYLVVDKNDDTAQAVLTIQNNIPVDFSSTPLGADVESKGDDFGDYLYEVRIFSAKELYADIPHAIASEMIDIANIKFVKFNSFQIPVGRGKSDGSLDDPRGSIHDNYGDMLDYKNGCEMFSLTSLWQLSQNPA